MTNQENADYRNNRYSQQSHLCKSDNVDEHKETVNWTEANEKRNHLSEQQNNKTNILLFSQRNSRNPNNTNLL